MEFFLGIYGIKLINFSHLNEHKFRHSLNDTIILICSCVAVIEEIIHYLLHFQLYLVQRVEILDGIYKLDSALHNSSEDQLLKVLLCGSVKNL